MLYIKKNEPTRKLKIVSIPDKGVQVVKNLRTDIQVLNRAYPTIDIDFVEVEDEFGPKKIEELSKEWNIPTNFMFIGSPGDKFPYRLEELGEVRLII
ncbi:hypothetical protein NYZ99_12065 [Maribacter litopenaei]|uniref:Uncharacterized protein n=1 Tax=Maribacter litopenaei TaxID=2976127 RepID=A0ABY5Y4C9_9FLAO|nr:hypothetical protein [Maribacter litopenaei]UWX53860.1 hypothetical protein NYZ99_12065 [Maribacter litopenaei]